MIEMLVSGQKVQVVTQHEYASPHVGNKIRTTVFIQFPSGAPASGDFPVSKQYCSVRPSSVKKGDRETTFGIYSTSLDEAEKEVGRIIGTLFHTLEGEKNVYKVPLLKGLEMTYTVTKKDNLMEVEVYLPTGENNPGLHPDLRFGTELFGSTLDCYWGVEKSEKRYVRRVYRTQGEQIDFSHEVNCFKDLVQKRREFMERNPIPTPQLTHPIERGVLVLSPTISISYILESREDRGVVGTLYLPTEPGKELLIPQLWFPTTLLGVPLNPNWGVYVKDKGVRMVQKEWQACQGRMAFKKALDKIKKLVKGR